jgi:hypothetical protein
MLISFVRLQEYKFVVTAKDGAPDPRIATATVTVEVVDVDDEMPIFHLTSYEAQVPENVPDYMVTQVKVGILKVFLGTAGYIRKLIFFRLCPNNGHTNNKSSSDFQVYSVQSSLASRLIISLKLQDIENRTTVL